MTIPLTIQKIATKPNSDGLVNWLPQPGLLRNSPQKSMRFNFNPLIKSCGTLTVSSPGTESIGLAADARGVMPTPPRRRRQLN